MSSEQGAVAVTVAIVLTMLLLFAALAIDLGGLRVDRSASQLAADMAAAAAVQDFDPVIPGDVQSSCLESVVFAEENLGIDLVASGAGCAVFPADQTCNDGAILRAEYTGTDRFGNDYTVVISNPVPANDALMGNQPVAASDGAACERIGVAIQRSRDYFFASFAGSGSTTMSAVGLGAQPGDEGEFASLIVLDRQACQALVASGNNTIIEVTPLLRDEGKDDDPQRYPGIITVDSRTDGCSNNSEVFNLDGQGAAIRAPEGFIYSYALRVGDPPGQVYPAGASGLEPTPRPGQRVTRAPVDHVYNCLETYPSNQRWSPSHPTSVSTIEGCDTSDNPPDPYLQNLHAAYQEMRADALPPLPPGEEWIVFPDTEDDEIPDSCSGNDATGTFGSNSGAYSPEGATGRYWFIDCPGTTGNSGFGPSDIHFDGVDAVVTLGQIRLQSSDSLRVTGTDDLGAVLYLQMGSLRGQGSFAFEDTFVYVDNGIIELLGQGDITWRGPLLAEFGDDLDNPPAKVACAGNSGPAPAAACFSPLALWSNSPSQHRLGGGGNLNIAGTFFTPNAGSGDNTAFRIAGGGGQVLDEAQFFSARLRADGGGTVRMTPNPETNVIVPLTGTALVR